MIRSPSIDLEDVLKITDQSQQSCILLTFEAIESAMNRIVGV